MSLPNQVVENEEDSVSVVNVVTNPEPFKDPLALIEVQTSLYIDLNAILNDIHRGDKNLIILKQLQLQDVISKNFINMRKDLHKIFETSAKKKKKFLGLF